MKSKKSQIVGQIFIFILATVVFVLIVMYGYRAISSLMVKGEQASLVKFQNELTNAVSSIALDYGSVKCEDFSVPKKYTEFCFVDTAEVVYSPAAANAPNSPWGKLYAQHPFIADSIKSGSLQNAFLIPPSSLSMALENARTEETNGFFCIKVARSAISIKLEGRGAQGVMISKC